MQQTEGRDSDRERHTERKKYVLIEYLLEITATLGCMKQSRPSYEESHRDYSTCFGGVYHIRLWG